MDVYIYPSCENLPFQKRPMNPELTYNGLNLESWKIAEGKNSKPVGELYLLPLLRGLLLVNLYQVVAHINFGYNIRAKTLRMPKKVWLEFSTKPGLFINGLPIVVDGAGNPCVSNLWRDDHGYETPYDLRGEMVDAEDDTPYEWSRFFLLLLRDQRSRLLKEAMRNEKEYERIVSAFCGL